MEKDRKGPKINANVVNSLLRQKFDALISKEMIDEDIRRELLEFSKEIVDGLKPYQIFDITGNTHDGVSYSDSAGQPKCPECGQGLFFVPQGNRLDCTDCDYHWEIKVK